MASESRGFIGWMENNFVPIAAKIGSQRHLVAIRDGFVAITPIIMAGCVVTVINNLPINIGGIPWAEWSAEHMAWLRTFNGNVWWGTMAMIALLICFTVPYNLVQSRGGNGLAGALTALSAYICVTPQVVGESWGGIPVAYTQAAGLFGVLVISMVAAELFSLLSKSDKLTIKMPDGVPPAVGKSFASLLPTILTIFIIVAVCQMIQAISGYSLFDLIMKFVSAPLTNIADKFGTMIGVIFFQQLLWIFGLHGSNIMGALTESVMLPMLTTNMDLVNSGKEAIHIVVKPFFDSFVNMGGAGSTLSLVLALFAANFIKKRRDPLNAHYMGMAKMSIGPGIFNINEPIMYGLPVVLNPVLIIPYILIPMVQGTLAYAATAAGIIPKVFIAAPWTMPPVLLAYIATGGSIMAALMALINLALGVVMYLPFVFVGDKAFKRDAEKEIAAEAFSSDKTLNA